MNRIWTHLSKHFHAYIVGFSGVLISIGLFYALQMQEDRYILSIAQVGIETLDSHIQSELAFDAHLLKHVTSQMQQDSNLHTTAPANIDDLLNSYLQLEAIAYASSPQQINWISTIHKSVDYNAIFAKFLTASEEKVKSRTATWISTPIPLANNRLGIFMVMPNPLQTANATAATDYLIVLIDTESLLNRRLKIAGVDLFTYINHNRITTSRKEPLDERWLYIVNENVFGSDLEIKARESGADLGFLDNLSQEFPISWLTFILGLLISGLWARSIALSDLLTERTNILDQINRDLKNEITNHIQTEASKKTLEKALLQGQKLQAIGTLAGGIAHDFNNLLYAIRGYVELAREDISQDSKTYKNLGRVLEATHRGQDLIAQILTFSRRQQHEFIPLDLKTEIDGALALLRPTVPQTVDIQFTATAEGHILGNKTQIHQIIVNLINNAVDAMDGEGTIKIMLSKIAAIDIHQRKISPFKTENYCKIEITDTGHGMDQATMDRVFEPFFTTKEVGKGTGLGLSTAHSIVKDHLGEIIINSQIGKGTTFTIFFPEREDLQEEQKDG